MASAWYQSKEPRTDGLVTTYQTLPATERHQACRLKTKLSLLMKRVVNMSKCSQSSRSLLVQMRDQLKEALESKGIVPPESPLSHLTSNGSDSPSARLLLNSTPRCHAQQPPTHSEAASTEDEESMDTSSGRTTPASLLSMRHLDCAYCTGFMVQPVCLPCGHSVCRSCLEKTVVGGDLLACPSCSQTFPCVPAGFSSNSDSNSERRRSGGNSGAAHAATISRKPTLILQNALLKWYPERVESSKHKDEGNIFANEGDFPMAIHWYSKALETGLFGGAVPKREGRRERMSDTCV